MLARRTEAIIGGMLAGIIGAGVLAALLVIDAVGNGVDVSLTLKAAAAPFIGDLASEPGFEGGAVLIGLYTRFGIGIVWGGLFGLLAVGQDRTVALGAVWGSALWLAYCALPAMAGLGWLAPLPPSALTLPAYVLSGMALGFAFIPFSDQSKQSDRPPVAG